MRPLLVLSPPRSGSTWVSEVLASAQGAALLHEPDSDPNMPFGLLAKAGLGRYPVLHAGDLAPRFAELWSNALRPRADGRPTPGVAARTVLGRTSLDLRNEILFGEPSSRALFTTKLLERVARPVSPPDGEHVIVKSVHTGLAAGFVTAVEQTPVVLVRRNPLNGVSSWLDLDWRHQRLGNSVEQEQRVGATLGAPPPDDRAPMERRQAWSYAALTRALDLEAERAGDWVVVQHEDLCRDPVARFEDLFSRIGLPWSEDVERTLASRDDAASGYVTKRVASEEPERWRSRLDADQEREIRTMAAQLNIET